MRPFMHSWGGSRTTIINNNFYRVGMPMCRPRPMFFGGFGGFGGCGCSGGGNLFNMMAGFSVASMFMNNMSGLFGFGANNNSASSYQGYYGGYDPYRGGSSSQTHKSSCDCGDYSSQLKDLNKKVDSLSARLDEMTASSKDDKDKKEIKADKEPVSGGENEKDKKNVNDTDDKKEVKANNDKKEAEVKGKENPEVISKKGDENFDKTVNTVLDKMGVKDLNDTQKAYIKNHISDVYQDENGNIRYNITAVTHDTDSTAIIANRFYDKDEKTDFTVGRANFNTQKSEKNTITEPHSGNIITLNGVSEYGLNALIKDAQAGITPQGEIAKTNKRMTQLKSDFENGTNKLSWHYVNQNNLMSKTAYDKIINEKY